MNNGCMFDSTEISAVEVEVEVDVCEFEFAVVA